MSTAERLRTQFAARFTLHGDGFVYRAGDHAPGIAISAAERDRFVAGFERHVLALQWICNPWLIIPAMIVAPPLVAHHLSTSAAVALFWAIVLLSGGAYGWAADAPSRALKGRPPLDKGLPKDVIRANELEKQTWPRLALNLLIVSVWLAVMIRDGRDYGLTARLIFGVLNAIALWLLLRDLFGKVAQRRRGRDADRPRPRP